jgi:hypothetical protein
VLAVAALLAGCAADNFVVGDGGSPDGDGGNDAWAQDTGMGDGPAATDGPALCGGAVCNGACVGGTRCLLAHVQEATCLAVDGANVYFAGRDRIGRVSKNGGTPAGSSVPNADFVACVLAPTHFIAADQNGGRIVSMAKSNPGSWTTVISGEPGVRRLAIPLSPQLAWAADGDGVRTCDFQSCSNSTTVLIGSEAFKSELAADSTYVFYTSANSGIVGRMNRAGGGPPTAITMLSAAPTSLAASSGLSELVFTYGTNVGAVSKLGGMIAVIASGRKSPLSVRADAMHAYWVDRDSMGSVAKAPLGGGGMVTELVSAVDTPTALEIDGPPDTGFVYYAAKDGIWRVPKQ